MKSVEHSAVVKPLPAKYFAILFEGPWLFTQDPADKTRILAVCPYLDPLDHAFEFGFWKDEDLSGLKDDHPEILAPGTLYKVDVQNAQAPAPSFNELFQRAAAMYPLIYLRNKTKGNPLKLGDGSNLRRVSLSRPVEIRAAGKLLHAPVLKGVASNEKSFDLGLSAEPANHAALILLYPALSATPSLTVQSIPVPLLAGAKPHLVFRARGTSNTFIDNYTDNLHLIDSFDMVRRLVMVQDPDFADDALSACDLGLYPSSGSQLFEHGDTDLADFSDKELGLPQSTLQGIADIRITALTLASCAAGTIVCNGDDMGE